MDIYNYGKDKNGGWDKTAIFTDARNFPDALAITPLAGKKHYPIFLVQGESLSQSVTNVFTASNFTDAIILCSDKSVSDGIATQIKAILGKDAERFWGSNRYATAKAIANYSANNGLSYNNAGIATGENFPDALTDGPFLAKHGAVLLLAKDSDTSTFELLNSSAAITKIHILGGEGAVSKTVREAAELKLGWPKGTIK